jgi:hypothetical protein
MRTSFHRLRLGAGFVSAAGATRPTMRKSGGRTFNRPHRIAQMSRKKISPLAWGERHVHVGARKDDGLPAEAQARGGGEVVAGEKAGIQAAIHL